MIDISRYDCDFTMEEQAEASEKHFAYLEKVHGEQGTTNRLAKLTDENVPYCVKEAWMDCEITDCYDCPRFDDILTKLAHYEDLEEQGRLVVLPEGFEREKFINYMASKHCPSYFGFKDKDRSQGKCTGGEECNRCWETALKGE